jgi:hypothetical protein
MHVARYQEADATGPVEGHRVAISWEPAHQENLRSGAMATPIFSEVTRKRMPRHRRTRAPWYAPIDPGGVDDLLVSRNLHTRDAGLGVSAPRFSHRGALLAGTTGEVRHCS